MAIIEIKDEVNVKFRGINSIVMDEAIKELTYFVPNYRFMPSYKMGRWDGQIRFLTKTGVTYLNLLDDILPIFSRHGIEFEILDHRKDYSAITSQLVMPPATMFSQYELKGNPVVLRDYQMNAIKAAITSGSGVLEMSTGAGKTLTCAAISKIYMEHGRVVVIVPDIGLVLQTHGLFKAMGLNPGMWYMDVKDRQDVTISTWQSLDNFPELFEGVICTIVDEAHKATGKTLHEMLTGPGRNVPFRFGCTGTLPKEEIFQTQIRSSIGPKIFEIKTKQLQDSGDLSKAHVTMINLQDTKNKRYPKTGFEEWKDQIDWFFKDKERLTYIAQLIQTVTEEYGNTLVLVQYRNAGKILNDLIPGSISLDGRDKADDRKDEYEDFNSKNNQVLICTAGIASTGIDIPRIFNLIIIEPGKKFQKIMQIFGRGVRTADDKTHLNVLDIHGNEGFSKTHSRERVKFYKEAQQPVEHIEVHYVDS